MTGANYSKRRRGHRVVDTVDGNAEPSEDHSERAVRAAVKKRQELTLGTLGESGASNDIGARRVEAHPILGSLSAAPIVRFTFDGVPVEGREGEPIVAALLAAGIRVLRTMPRFDDARGGYCMIGRCTDCMFVMDGVPNVRACITPVGPDLVVQTQRGLGEGAVPWALSE